MTQDAWMVTTKYDHSHGFPAEPQRAESREAEAVSKQNGVSTLAYSLSETRTQSAFGTRRQGNWLVVPYDNFFEVNLVFCHARAVLMIIIHIIFGIIWFLLSSPVSPFHHPLLEHLDRSSALLDSKRAYYTTTPEAQSVRRHTAPKPVTVSARRKKQASSLLGVPRSPVYMTEPTEAMACTSP